MITKLEMLNYLLNLALIVTVFLKTGSSETNIVRLINTESSISNPVVGRLEIYHNGTWGTVCDREWQFTEASARVACATLGFGYIGTVIVDLFNRRAREVPVLFTEINCVGTEQSIDECAYNDARSGNCSFHEIVWISCALSVRLNNTRSCNPKEGRLEVNYNGTWGTVCNDGFTNANARVACASLGFGYVGTVINNSYGRGSDPILLNKVSCFGTEQRIDECSYSLWGSHNCSHSEDVAINCALGVRLYNTRSSNPTEGRLEIYNNGSWGTVCDYEFTNANARVACANLGFGDIGAFIGNQYGTGTGHIGLDDVRCAGTAYGYDRCYHSYHSASGLHNCNHHKDVSITCSSKALDVRLINTQSSNPREGRLEIYYSGIWGTVCDDRFTDANARVACASLGYGYIGAFIGNRHGAGIGPIWLDGVKCAGTEYGIDSCYHSTFGLHNCDHDEDVSIICKNIALGVRLSNTRSSNPKEGRLEVNYNGIWGTVREDGFTDANARVACASLGFGYVGTVVNNSYGSGSGPIWLNKVSCFGTEQRIDECSHSFWGSHNCSHSEDVAINCALNVRLNNTQSTYPREGRLEIYYNGTWGTVCDDGFTNANARVACASLGYGYIGARIRNRHGPGTGPIWLNDVHCAGTENGIDRCHHGGLGLHNCNYNQEASIICAFEVRLNNTQSSYPKEGRLEVNYNGIWGTVCDNGFTDANARVACASLGFGYVGTVINNSHGSGSGQFRLCKVSCIGTEHRIDECSYSFWSSHNCSQSEDVAINCAPGVRLNNTRSSNPTEGRLEIYYNGTWGTVCDYGFTNAKARVACWNLGFGYIGAYIGNQHGAGTGHIWLDASCVGAEYEYERCYHGYMYHSASGLHHCNHNKDVSIACSSIGCGKTEYNDAIGFISSPGFPNTDYFEDGRNLTCTYSIKRSGQESVTILFPVFYLYDRHSGYSGYSRDQPCSYDWVEINCADDWYKPNIRRYCGSNRPPALEFKSCDHVIIRFHIDDERYRGSLFQLTYGFKPAASKDEIFAYSGLPIRGDIGQNITCPGSSRQCNSSHLNCGNIGLCCEIHNTSDKYCMCHAGYGGYECYDDTGEMTSEVIEKPSSAPWILLGVFAVLVGLSFLTVISLMIYKSCKPKQDSGDNPQTMQLRNISPGAHNADPNEDERESGGYEHIQQPSSIQAHDNYYESISG